MPIKKDLVSAILCNREPVFVLDRQFEALEKAGNVTLQSKHRIRLQKILDSYNGLFVVAENAVDIKKAIKRIEELQKAAFKLRIFFDAPPEGKERSAIDRALLARLKSQENWDVEKRLKTDHLLHLNGHLKLILKEYATRPISKDGRNRDDILDALVLELYAFHARLSTAAKKIRRLGVGRDSFIRSAIKIIPHHPKQSINPQALSQRIKRLTSVRYKTSKAKG